ncbi:hypothetical protein BKA93DRAFT_506738 [Sparassis latifolia]
MAIYLSPGLVLLLVLAKNMLTLVTTCSLRTITVRFPTRPRGADTFHGTFFFAKSATVLLTHVRLLILARPAVAGECRCYRSARFSKTFTRL